MCFEISAISKRVGSVLFAAPILEINSPLSKHSFHEMNFINDCIACINKIINIIIIEDIFVCFLGIKHMQRSYFTIGIY